MQDDVQHTRTLPGVGQDQVPVVDQGERRERPAWVDDARAGLDGPGKYLIYDDDGRKIVVAISREWTRIGRSLAADVRFDDATVSRRHALVVSQADGDEITVGRHTIFYLDTTTVGAQVAATGTATAE